MSAFLLFISYFQIIYSLFSDYIYIVFKPYIVCLSILYSLQVRYIQFTFMLCVADLLAICLWGRSVNNLLLKIIVYCDAVLCFMKWFFYWFQLKVMSVILWYWLIVGRVSSGYIKSFLSFAELCVCCVYFL